MPDQFNEELGRRIRAARVGKLTQAALGSRVGLSRTAITNIECGRQRLLVDQLVDIATAIGVSAGDLLPSRSSAAAVDNGDAIMSQMPTVQKWLSDVKKNASRGRT
jgi:transcriptional regulator with XRE-family HTH domain